MSKILSSLLLILLVLFIACGGSKTESEVENSDTEMTTAESDTSGILDKLSKENIDEMYDQLVLGEAPDFVMFNLDGTRYTKKDLMIMSTSCISGRWNRPCPNASSHL